MLTEAENDCRGDRIVASRELLTQIKRISGEGQGVVTDYENSNKSICKIGIPSIVALLLFMQHKAESAEITFEVKIMGDLQEMLRKALSEQDAATLLVDLLENAITAINRTDNAKHKLAEISGQAGNCFIRVSDSGFPQEVLDHWGIRRITTHKETGGSGIGLMTIYEICQKYHASFSIDSAEDSDLYTKSLTVRFDGKGIVKLKNELG